MKTGKYSVEFETHAWRELSDLPKEIIRQMADIVSNLEDNPRPPGAKKLTAREGYRIRKGNYRILYTIDDKDRLVRIYRIGHRKEIYR